MARVLNGSISSLSEQDSLAQAGKVWVVNCQTPGTAIAYAALTAFSATANGLFVIYNGNAPGGANLIVKRLDLFQTATAPVGTTWSLESYLESGSVLGTTAVITRTPVQINPAGGSGQSTNMRVQAFNAGAITIPAQAAGSTRLLAGQGWVATGVSVVKDVTTVDFGSDAPAAAKTGLTAARATDVARLTGQMPSLVIPPQWTGWINLWGPGTNAPSFEYNLVIVESD